MRLRRGTTALEEDDRLEPDEVSPGGLEKEPPARTTTVDPTPEAGTDDRPETLPDLPETDPVTSGDAGAEKTAGDVASQRRRPGTFTLVAAGLALVGLVVLALGGLSWYRASHDSSLDAAATRDRALVAASTEIATLNTLDYRDVDGGIKSWLDITTGTLHDQLAQAGNQDEQLLAGQKKITTGKVVAAALTDLDASQGTATAIASVEITVRSTSGQADLKRNRFSADLVLKKGRWLLESLTQVPVQTS